MSVRINSIQVALDTNLLPGEDRPGRDRPGDWRPCGDLTIERPVGNRNADLSDWEVSFSPSGRSFSATMKSADIERMLTELDHTGKLVRKIAKLMNTTEGE